MKDRVTIKDIAGFCPEEAVWKMLADVSAYLLDEQAFVNLTPDSIVIDECTFMIETGQDKMDEFLAPEQFDGCAVSEKQRVWSLGAIAYFASMGHYVFGGQGGIYQHIHPSVSLPVLSKDFHSLTTVLQKCLCCDPEERMGLEMLKEKSMEGLHHCKMRQRKNIEQQEKEQKHKNNNIGDRWPEKMIEL